MARQVWVAVAPIYVGLARAFNVGDIVPDTIVTGHGYAASGLVESQTVPDDPAVPFPTVNPATQRELDAAVALLRSEASASAGLLRSEAAAYVSRGSLTLNVKDYGAKGDGVTDDTAAINAALAACAEGAEVFFPAGTFLVSSPIVLKRNRTLRGIHAPRWAYDTGGPSRIKASATFVGDAIIRLKDEEDLFGSVGAAANGQLSGPNDQCGQRLIRLTLDGFNVAGGIDGVLASGLIRDVRMVEVCVRRCTGNGIHTIGHTRTDGKSYFPRGWALQQVVADTSGNNGFSFNLLNDSTLVDCLAVAATNHGFYIAGAGELLLSVCRSVYNKQGNGFYLTGSCYGNVVLSGCSTDRNQQHGILIDATGKQPILLSGVALRRDGGNNNGGGGGYAGLCVSGSNCPVTVAGITTQTGVDDSGAGAWTPQYGIKVANSSSVAVSIGVLWGRDAAVSDGGGNTNFRIGAQVVKATGTTVTPTFTYSPDPAATTDLLAVGSGDLITSGIETWGRDQISGTAVATSSGDLVLTYFTARSTLTATKLSVIVETAAGGLTSAQLALYSVDAAGNLTLVGATASDAAMFASTGQVTKALPSSVTVTAGQRYAFAVLAVGTTPPALASAAAAGTGAAWAIAPRMTGKLTGQTAAGASYTAASIIATARRPFGVLVP